MCVSEKVIEKNKEVKGIRERLRVWKVELDVIIVIVRTSGGGTEVRGKKVTKGQWKGASQRRGDPSVRKASESGRDSCVRPRLRHVHWKHI